MVTLTKIKNHPQTKVLMQMADKHLEELGYTEHGFRHARLVAKMTEYILKELKYNQHDQRLGAIAGYMHDLGNAINRHNHAQASAFFAYEILKDLKLNYKDITKIVAAVGNHDEETGEPVSPISAAVVIADKADVHRSRVRTLKEIDFDIHDRVNYAVKKSRLHVNKSKRTITLALSINTRISTVMEYFKIFLTRMIACQKAAKLLGREFKLVINKTKLL